LLPSRRILNKLSILPLDLAGRGILLETKTANRTFERRRYELLRREALAPAIGSIAMGDYEQRRYDEITSALAEALRPEEIRSVINTEYSFDLSAEGKLIAKDGEPIEHMLEKALQKDIGLASRDKFYSGFLPARTKHELDELRELQAMAADDLGYNTIVVFSPYTEELDTSELNRKKLIKANQKPYWKRAMLRVSHWDGDRLHIFTRSIDNSSVELMKQTASRQFGRDMAADNSTDMLGERIRLDIADGSWKSLADDTVKTADDILARTHGGRRCNGNPEELVADAQMFVEAQTMIINSLLEIDKKLARTCASYEQYQTSFEHQMYNYIALLEKNIESGKAGLPLENVAAASAAAGATARAEGKSYDMCGHVIEAGSEAETSQLTGFESLMRYAGKPVECPFCEKKVVVPVEDLIDGKLYCKNCDTGIDVCTGKKFSKGRAGQSVPKVKFLDQLGRELTQWNRDYQLAQAMKKQAARRKKAA